MMRNLLQEINLLIYTLEPLKKEMLLWVYVHQQKAEKQKKANLRYTKTEN